MPLKEWEALSISVPISWNVTSSGNNSENGSSLANRHQGNNKIDLEQDIEYRIQNRFYKKIFSKTYFFEKKIRFREQHIKKVYIFAAF